MSTTPAETPVLSFVQSLEESTSNVRVKVKTGQIWAQVKETIEESIALKGSFSISNGEALQKNIRKILVVTN